MSKGIIISGGGRYLLCALVNIRILRNHGCGLPIELWHFPNERLPGRARRELLKWDVITRELPKLPNGYASKPYAIAHSNFEEVLVLDADNTPIRNPEYLFDSAPYKETGAIFWPDFEMALPNEAWTQLANLEEPLVTHQQESGQILIHRTRCEKAIKRTLDYNLNYPDIAHLLWGCGGDKDTYQLAWFAERTEFHMIPYMPGSAGQVTDNTYRSNTLVQHDPEGKPLFMHKNAKKWHLVRQPEHCWDRFIFAKTPSGNDLEVKLSGNSHSHTHEFYPKERTYQVEAEKIVGNLEETCLAAISKLRKSYWYLEAVFLYYLSDYGNRLTRKKSSL